MKKILMGTTAIIALATFTSEAAAAEKISLGLGGFQRAYAAKVTRQEASPKAHMKMGAWTNTEVHVKGSTTLDNGVTVSTRIEFEADGSANSHKHRIDTAGGATATNSAASGSRGTDESSLTISSDAMGAVTVGATSGAGDKMAIGAPAIGPNGLFSGGGGVEGLDGADFAWSANGTGVSDDMSVKAVYMSPDFNGVTVGLSFTPGEGFGGESNGKAVRNDQSEDGFQAAVAYSGEMSGAAVDVALVHEFNNKSNVTSNGIGVNVGMNGITVGGSYWDQNDNQTNGTALDGSAYDLGVAYESGAMSVAVSYGHATSKGGNTVGVDNKDTMWSIGAGYDLGAGVGLVAQYYSAKADSDATTAAVTSKAFIAGIEVGF